MARITFWSAVAVLIGTTIGAGILGLPSVIAKSGFFTGIIDLILIGIAILILNLYMGEVTLRTKGKHQLSGYAKKYLGSFGKNIVMIAMAIGIYGAITAYTFGGGDVLASLFNGADPAIYSLIFFSVLMILVFFGLDIICRFELLMITLMIGLIVVISALCFGKIDTANLSGFNPIMMLAPYGVILFAFIGLPAIPEMREELNKNKKHLKKAIILGTLIPLIIYLLFAVVVVGVVGLDGFSSLGTDKQVATIALSEYVNNGVGVIANIFALFAMATSFLALGIALNEMYVYDYGFHKIKAWLFAAAIPLGILFIDSYKDITNFVEILGFAGAISGGILGLSIISMHRLAKAFGERKPEFEIHDRLLVSVLLIILFIIGIAYQIFI
ncbi:MAG: amino acid permease [bacterium]|nr:amino acid permease [bacterium]